VDNALDVCEEVETLPDVLVEIKEVESTEGEYEIVMRDNGPGIVESNVPKVFGRLLYGSRFHVISQSRGQQGIGISAAVLYSQLSTGKPARIISKTITMPKAKEFILSIDTARNKPEVHSVKQIEWVDEEGRPITSGTEIHLNLIGRYVRGRQSVFEYLKSTAIVNPHARITLIEPDGTKWIFERGTEMLPVPPKPIKPHPYGIEIGTLIKMAKNTKAKDLRRFLVQDFERISDRLARKICSEAGLTLSQRPSSLGREEAKRLLKVMQKTKFMEPPTDCLSPIGEKLIKRGLKKEIDAEFFAANVRSPKTYQGHPFLVEAGLCYGVKNTKAKKGEKKTEEEKGSTPITILRFANRVPLLYQQGGCLITKAIENVNWRNYGLEQRGGRGIPRGPAVVLVHIASTNVPFTSEAKEAVAHIEAIQTEIELALRECGRKMKQHIARQKKRKENQEKLQIIEMLLPQINEKTSQVISMPKPSIVKVIGEIMNCYMFVTDIQYTAVEKKHTVNIKIENYTNFKKKFSLYLEL
ncbi:MAG TPA: DNA topoisomerase VI subunit B, partial [Thermoplasmata archaeon]|nr:DNA topoisomerase VI subunit B [Thermoplasmata archaeon]